MLGILSQILCWIKQIGAMVLNALIAVVNLFIAGIAAVVEAAIDAWPIEMPDLPAMPGDVVTVMGWIAWSPFPLAALWAFVFFAISVWIAWQLIAIVLRWAKAGE